MSRRLSLKFGTSAIGGAVAGTICWYLGVSALDSLSASILATGLGVGTGAMLGEFLIAKRVV